MIDPIERYQHFKGWIPATDVDGIDAPKDYLRDVQNADFNNGFIANAAAPILVPHHSNVTTAQSNGWEILSKKYFKHSSQGHTYVYILYKFDAGQHKLRYFVNNTELTLGNGLSSGVVNAKPSSISYNLVSDQLKVNLNVQATYDTNKYVVMNLSVLYLPQMYYNGKSSLTRSAGWYIIPRWLGWTYSSLTFENSGSYTNSYTEDFADGSYIPNFSFESDWDRRQELIYFPDYHLFASNASSSVRKKTNYVIIEDINPLKSIQIQARLISPPSADSEVYVGYELYESDGGGTPVLTLVGTGVLPLEKKLITVLNFEDINVSSAVPSERLVLKIYADLGRSDYMCLDYIKLTALDELAVIVKNFDGQRQAIGDNFSLGLYGTDSIKIKESEIDWRVKAYEVYMQIGGLKYLVKEILVSDTGTSWVDAAPYLTSQISDFDFESSETINFNYGLGASVSVYTKVGDLIGRIMTDEAFYRNRSYYVDGSNKLYYSHISGTALAQPDSFPYDEDARFGYYITSHEASNRAVAVTSMEEIVILTDKLDYVYTIEGTAGTPLRRIKAINGSMGILNPKSLLVDLAGNPEGKILLWADEWAIYGYAGGRDIPVPLTAQTHKNYWRSVVGKYDAVAVYNKATNEFWLQLDDHILIYELDTNTWKKYVFSFRIKDIVGIMEGYTYILGDDGKMYKLDPAGATKLQAIVEFHDNACYDVSERGYITQAPEIQDKVLQDMFIHWKDICGGSCEVQIIADDNNIDSPITLSTAYSRFPSRTPLLVVYGKIRFRITIDVVTAKLKEFGFAFNLLPTASPAQSALSMMEGRGLGQEAGGEHGVVF